MIMSATGRVDRPPPSRAWYDSWAARSAIVVALLAGAAAGGFGLDRWRTHEATVAARSAVDLFASVTTMEYTNQDRVSIGVRYRNDGEHDLVIRDVRLDTNQVFMVSDQEPLSVEPGETVAHILELRAECVDGATPVGSPPLDIEVETIDGTIRHEIIDIGLASELVGWLNYTCEALAYEQSFGNTHAEVVSVTRGDDDNTVRAEIFFGVDESQEITITSMETETDVFAVDYNLGDASSSSSFPPLVTASFRINDCAAALEANERDMTLAVSGANEGTGPGTLTIPPTATLAAELVRLAERSCAG